MNKLINIAGSLVLAAGVVAPASADIILDDFVYYNDGILDGNNPPAINPTPGFDTNGNPINGNTLTGQVGLNLTNAVFDGTGVGLENYVGSSFVGHSPLAQFSYSFTGGIPANAGTADPVVLTGDDTLSISIGNNDNATSALEPAILEIVANPVVALDFSLFGTHFYVDAIRNDLVSGFSFTASLEVGGETYTASLPVTQQISSLTRIPFSFNQFMNAGGTESYADVGGKVDRTVLRFEVSSGETVDFALDQVGVFDASAPAALGFLGLAISVVGLRRRRLI